MSICRSLLFLISPCEQVWPTSAALGVLFVIHDVCNTECILHLIHNVCHHEIFYRDVNCRNKYHLLCFK